MKNIVSAYTARKWWYRTIRSLSWFSFRYFWFVWICFILLTAGFWMLLRQPMIQKTCSIDVIENSIITINERLTHCCNCSLQQDTSNIAPPTPPNTSACNGEADDNGRNIPPPPKYFEVGNQSGTIRLCYDNGEIHPDNIIIKHNGQILKQTGSVIGKNCINIPYVYHPGDPTFVEVNVQPSGNSGTRWWYSLGCPQ